MKKILPVMLAIAVMSFACGFKRNAAEAPAPVAGEAVIGVTVTEIVAVANGWSAQKQILGQDVYNDKNEKVGKVYDIIIAPDKAVSFGIIGRRIPGHCQA